MPGVLLGKVVPIAGTIISFFMYLAPSKAVMTARRRGALGDLNPLPLVLMLGNAAGWVAYSVATTPPDIYIFLCNALGTLLGLFYTVSAISLATAGDVGSEADSAKTVNVISGTALGSAALIMACGGVQAFLPSMTAAQHELLWGAAANLILIAFFSSPLSSLAHVLRTRCSATIFANWPLSVVSTANSALWTAYGLAIGRPFVWAPNAFGCVLGVVQLLLCALLPTRVSEGVVGAAAANSNNSSNKAGSPKGGDESPRLVAVSMRVTPAARGAAGGRVAPLEGGSNSGLSSRSGSGSGGVGGGIGGAGGRSLSRAWSAGQWSAAPGQPSGAEGGGSGVRQLWTRLSNSFGGSSRGGRDGNSATNSRRRLRAAGGRDSAGDETAAAAAAPVAVGTVDNVDVEAAAAAAERR